MTEPTTEAGKRLAATLRHVAILDAEIAAIEAEAASNAFREMAEQQTDLALSAVAAERARIRREVEALEFDGLDESWCWEQEIRAAVLAIVGAVSTADRPTRRSTQSSTDERAL